MGLQMEQRLEEALRSVVKRMIARLQKCLIGNKRADIPACFTVTLVIDKNNRIELKPSVQVSPLQLGPTQSSAQCLVQAIVIL